MVIFTSNSGWRLHEEVDARSALPEQLQFSFAVEDRLTIDDEMTIEDGLTIEYHENCRTIDENDDDDN